MEIPTILSGEYEADFQQQQNQTLRTLLSTTGWRQPPLTTAQRNMILSYTWSPVLPVGTFWFNTDVGAPEVIVTQAVPSTSTNATYKTYTIT